ncbi:MAG: ribbon-helix-helix domain-containing protein [Rhodomicrobiaceae bacterium]|jgi:predicted DNA-binding ribbon-helix-helix protein|nr:MAG: aryl-sulfate sulfotransferase [Methyloligella sp.]
MQDIPKKRSLTLKGHRTSISLEDAFWSALNDIANKQTKSISELVEIIDENRGEAGLSSTIRIYILQYYRSQLAAS